MIHFDGLLHNITPEWMLVPKVGVLGAERFIDTNLSTLLFGSDVAEHVHLCLCLCLYLYLYFHLLFNAS